MNKKIIVIDDSQTIRDQVGTTLRQAGYEILEAVDGIDGASVIEKSPDAALVICDVNMPKRNGLELLEGLRKDDRFKTLPWWSCWTSEGQLPPHRARAQERREGLAGQALLRPTFLLAAVRKLTAS